MAEHVITKGLDLPIAGAPSNDIVDGAPVTQVGIVGHDYPTMKPRLHVGVGDTVKRGQLLFEDRKSEGVRFTSPGAGTVKAVHRGEKRKFLSLVVELNAAERSGNTSADDHETFDAYTGAPVDALTAEQVRDLLSQSGLWTAIRQRPFERVPSVTDTCAAIFVTATTSNPLAAPVETLIAGQEAEFVDGLKAVSKLTEGKTFLCVSPKWTIDTSSASGVQTEYFSGKHPAGLVGTHIHLLCPAGRKQTVWHIGAQDVVAVGHLVRTGRLYTDRMVAIAGPATTEPQIVRTRLGASVLELTEGRVLEDAEVRIVSGSVLYGQTAQDETVGFINRYHDQLSCLAEDRERVFFGWLGSGIDKFSTVRAFVSRWLPSKAMNFTTTTHGSHRAMVPIGMFERVMPLDIMPTFLLRSLLVGDLERAEELGCLELSEEDLALCSFVSPGKEDYGVALRNVLTDIWQEG